MSCPGCGAKVEYFDAYDCYTGHEGTAAWISHNDRCPKNGYRAGLLREAWWLPAFLLFSTSPIAAVARVLALPSDTNDQALGNALLAGVCWIVLGCAVSLGLWIAGGIEGARWAKRRGLA